MADGTTQQDLQPQHFSLLRELAEVYLLLDNLSGSATKNLGADVPDAPRLGVGRATSDGGATPADSSQDWIETICKIAWPPTGSRSDEAADIADLIRVRDYLNRKAAPANGGTIAFTLLVGDGGRSDEGSGKASASGGDPPPITDADWGRAQLSRVGLADLAFPGLQARALSFRRWMVFMAAALAVVLFITCALSWNTAHGNALLGQWTAAQTDLAATQAQIVTASGGDQNAGGGSTQPPAATAAPAQGGSDAAHNGSTPPASPPKPFARYCDQAVYFHPAPGSTATAVQLFTSPTQAKLCDDLDRKNAAVAAASGNLGRWVSQWRWLLPADRTAPPASCGADCLTARAGDADSQFAASLLGVLSGAVLPFLYGLLGAGAAVVRTLAARLREWQLDPRDLLISFIQLALGAVLGACIGLFVTPAGAAGVATDTGSGAAASQGLLGPVHLSAAALCFIAGFFVEGVFKALEELMNRIFNLNSPGQPAKS